MLLGCADEAFHSAENKIAALRAFDAQTFKKNEHFPSYMHQCLKKINHSAQDGESVDAMFPARL